jgi:parallel beta-helix repeat protein
MSDNFRSFGVDGWTLSDFINDVDSSNIVDGKPTYYWVNKQNQKVPADAGYVALVNSTNITVQSLDLKNNIQGLLLAYTKNSLVTSNNITNNWWDGIWLYYSDNNTIAENNVADNVDSIHLEYSGHNTIIRNNFIENIYQAIVVPSEYANAWNESYPSGGNYWSNHPAVDVKNGFYQNETGSDGISDMPYIIDANNTDNYPLMGMLSDFNATPELHVQTICNSTIFNFKFNGTAIRFNVSGEDGTSGFCRICIPISLMNGNYTVFINGKKVQHNLLPCFNSTHIYLYFTYEHSTKEVIIIPEFPPILIILPFMIATLLTAIAYKRKQHVNVSFN